MKINGQLKAVFFTGMIVISACGGGDIRDTRLESHSDSAFYYMGLIFGQDLKEESLDTVVDLEVLLKGMESGLNTAYPSSDEIMIQTYLDMLLDDYKQEVLHARYGDYIAENEKFLSENAQKENTVTLPNGLQYNILREGNGEKPLPTDRILVQYTGYLIDGTVFETTYDRDGPVIFRLTSVIPGWREIVPLMPEGSKWRVVIPAPLAYGSDSPENSPILPFSTLIYEIELLEVDP